MMQDILVNDDTQFRKYIAIIWSVFEARWKDVEIYCMIA